MNSHSKLVSNATRLIGNLDLHIVIVALLVAVFSLILFGGDRYQFLLLGGLGVLLFVYIAFSSLTLESGESKLAFIGMNTTAVLLIFAVASAAAILMNKLHS